MIIVGSRAANYRIPSFKRKYDADTDVWTDVEIDRENNLDVSIVSSEIIDAFEDASVSSSMATLNDLYTIKVSHLPYDIFWKKHRSDALVFQKHGATLNRKLYELLKGHWKMVHSGEKSKLSLYKTADEFFDDFVEKPYVHDYLHELVAHPNKPVYTRCLKDGHEVFIDKEKFFSLSFDDQVKMFREEMAVIACERWILNPKAKNIHYGEAWNRSCHKTTTALTKGWASEFICENMIHFVKPNPNEVKHLLDTLKS